ncbi:MAG: stage II sporulation protein D [Clostridia bacterium]|nr:stage II sporulation protein D [Clostridia bacterium]
MSNKYLKNVKSWYVLVLFLIYMLICFLIPSMINGKTSKVANSKESEKEVQGVGKNNKTNVDALPTGKIKLLLTESNQVVEMNLEDYLKGVLIGEVPVTYEMEALKAQAVVARTYTLYKLKNAITKHEQGADMCDDINCCQAYKTKEYAFASWDDNEENEKWAKYENAVNATAGEVILYNKELINAFFHAHSGGTTENVKYLWSKNEIPYLVSVPGNEGYIYQDTKSFTKTELAELLKSDVANISGEIQFEIKDYTGSGRVNHIAVNGIDLDGARFRSLLGIKSTNFRIEESGDNIIFFTVGYGHGIGMSQEGANQMALDGNSYVDIIKHYYTGVEVAKLED